MPDKLKAAVLVDGGFVNKHMKKACRRHPQTVDMKIGLDVAWLSNKGIVEKIILVANDRDFIPPMKHARREGVRVTVIEWQGRYRILPELREHADEVRVLQQSAEGSFQLLDQRSVIPSGRHPPH